MTTAKKPETEATVAPDLIYGIPAEEFYAKSINEREEIRAAQRVPIYLMKDNDRYKGDVVVCVNGRIDTLKRGMTLQIRTDTYEQLMNQQRQDMIAAELVELAKKNKLIAEL